MATENNNQQINQFTGGMNTDLSYNMLEQTNYTLAKNLRIASLPKINGITNNNQYGQLRPIEGIKTAYSNTPNSIKVNKILASTAVRQYGVIVFTDENNKWCVARFTNTIESVDLDIKDLKVIFGPSTEVTNNTKFSIVTRYENEDNIKLYIADGNNPIMILNIALIHDDYNINLNGDITKIQAYPQIKFKSPIFDGLTVGNLKPALIQYSYQLYKKNGIQTEISPATKLIPISNANNVFRTDGKSVSGILKEANSSCGIKLRFDISNDYDYLDNMIIYRITYVENGQEPTIENIYDGYKISKFGDVGQTALSYLTLQEYNNMSGIHVIPKMIESKDDYLFASNIQTKQNSINSNSFKAYDSRAYQYNKLNQLKLYDKYSNYTAGDSAIDYTNKLSEIAITSDAFNSFNDINTEYTEDQNKCAFDKQLYYGGEGINISWRFIIAELNGDTTPAVTTDNFGKVGTKSQRIQLQSGNGNFTNSIEVCNITSTGTITNKHIVDASQFFSSIGMTNSYADTECSYYLKSLKRDELYRYGIIFYDKYGLNSEVKWIADIRTPNMYYKGFEPFISHGNNKNGNQVDLIVRPLGIEFTVNNMPSDAVSYEIVRCGRTESDVATVSQGVLSRPMQRLQIKDYTENQDAIYNQYTPTGLLTTGRFWAGEDVKYRSTIEHVGGKYEADNYENKSLFQFVSPEVCYEKDTVESEIKDVNLKLLTQLYLFGSPGEKDYDPKDLKGVNIPDVMQVISPSYSNCNLLNGYKDVYFSPNNGTYKNTAGTDVSFYEKYNINKTMAQYTSALGSIYYRDRFSRYVNKISGPLEIALTGMIIGYGGYSYSKPTDDSLQLVGNWYQSALNGYSYIKLYNQSNNVLVRQHSVNTIGGMVIDTDGAALSRNTYESYVVGETAFATEPGWNDFVEHSNYDGKPTYNCKAYDSVTSIGTEEYVNWVLGGTYGLATDNGIDEYKNKYQDGNKSIQNNTRDQAILGPGGRCLLLHLNNEVSYNPSDPNIYPLSDTIGTQYTLQPGNTTFSSLTNVGVNSNYQAKDIDKVTVLDLNGTIRNGQFTSNDVVFYRNSISGTYLCNLRRITIPYGGYDYQSRLTNIYHSYGNVFSEASINKAVFDGDCFIMPFEYISMHKCYDSYLNNMFTFMIGYSIPVETNINLAYTSGNEFSRHVKDNGSTNLQIQPSSVNGKYVQTDPLYSYNTAYSANSKTKVLATYDYLNDTISKNTVDYRTYYSNVKQNDESIDSWIKFMSANYLDVDTRFGQLTNLRTFNNELIYWQEHGIGKFSVNERSVVTDDSDTALILGSGGVLSRYDYLDQTSGMGSYKFADTKSDSTLYWFDDGNKEIKQYSGGNQIVSLSKYKNVQDIINKLYEKDNEQLFFDNQYNEIISKVLGDQSISYSERGQEFTSLYTIPFDSTINFNNGEYLIRANSTNLQIAKWNEVNNNITTSWNASDILPMYLSYVVNTNPLNTKVFDNQEIVSSNSLSSTKYNKSIFENLKYTFDTDLNNSSVDTLSMTDREGNFRYSIPRANNALYGDRIRGKYMLCTIEGTIPQYDFSISYIITKFRTSWA